MAAPQIFRVLTEFKFEVGAAVVNTQRLQSAVEGVSSSANEALFSLKRLGIGLVADFGLGASSLLGILGQALKTSDNFTKSQLGITTLISANMENLSGNVSTLNDRLLISRSILKDISEDAAKFNIPEQQLFEFTKLVGGFLLPKGLAGANLGQARSFSRNLLKAAPTLGVNPQFAGAQALRAIEGRAGGENVLFRRLAAETQVFAEKFKTATNVAKAFNKLPLKERFQLLNEGLGQFTKDLALINLQAQTFDRLFTRLRDLFVGLNGILKPLGDVLSGPIKKAFNDLIRILDKEGRETIINLSKALKPLLGDLKSLAVNLLQIRELSADLRRAGILILVIALLSFFKVLVLVRGAMVVIGFLFKSLAIVLAFIGPALKFLAFSVFPFLAAAAIKFSLALLPVLVIFQLISRAIAIARVRDLLLVPQFLAQLSVEVSRLATLFQIVFGPALELFNQLAEAISPIFSLAFILEKLVPVVRTLVDIFVTLFAIIQGFVFGIAQFVENIKGGKILGAFEGIQDQFQTGVNDFFDQFLARTQTDAGETRVASNVTNINKIEINNQFKEQLEPDRIAFTLKNQLLKAAQNPTQANGGNFSFSKQGR